MLEGAAGVVGRIDEDALDLSGIDRQQGLQGVEVVALNNHVFGGGVAIGEFGYGFEETVRNARGCGEVLVASEPFERGHG